MLYTFISIESYMVIYFVYTLAWVSVSIPSTVGSPVSLSSFSSAQWREGWTRDGSNKTVQKSQRARGAAPPELGKSTKTQLRRLEFSQSIW